ncbi:unnamed protein product, partial [Urochloa humidicola]
PSALAPPRDACSSSSLPTSDALPPHLSSLRHRALPHPRRVAASTGLASARGSGSSSAPSGGSPPRAGSWPAARPFSSRPSSRPTPPLRRAPRRRCCRGSSRLRAAAGARLNLQFFPTPPARHRLGSSVVPDRGLSPAALSPNGLELRRARERARPEQRAAAAARRDLEDATTVVDSRDAGEPLAPAAGPHRWRRKK